MDDGNGLELSLGLSCGGSSSKLKAKSASSADIRTDEVDRGSKLVDDFKNFLHGGTPNQDSGNGSQRSDPPKPEESFFSNLSKAAIDAKPTTLFDDISHQKKREREADLHEKSRTSHISINTDDGSTADNEDVADSEVDGSTSRLVSHQGRGSSEVPKEVHGVNDSSVGDLQGQKRYKVYAEKDFKLGNMSYGSTFPPQSLPMLDKDNPGGSISHPQQLHPYLASQGLNSATMPVIPHKSAEAPQYDGRPLERAKVDGKQHATQEGSSSHMEGGAKGSNIIFRARESSDQPKPEASPSEYPAIRPGIATDLKFGGSGSYPNLPWVSTTGPGPNGRTISGVTYRFSATQIRIVCACHGTHMSPEEFVRHAGEEQTHPEAGSGLASLPSNNPAASAQS